MAIKRTCDFCNAEIQTAGRETMDWGSAPQLTFSAPGIGAAFDCCVECLRTAVRALGERFARAPRSSFVESKAFWRELTNLEQADAQWISEHPSTEEG